ncbi:MAG: hypothetical protein M3211_11235, partial [Actinomycetota bacterium]|nr:hypothetical protein [Actinomycetota bacterium]
KCPTRRTPTRAQGHATTPDCTDLDETCAIPCRGMTCHQPGGTGPVHGDEPRSIDPAGNPMSTASVIEGGLNNLDF